ncbi:hypothetical protein EHV15_32615 [Paenibacillus oralis]|uniref:WD40 repeat domain-containing protein n=1 Tax=Paenibacillus oralis TaxID=2490856 RepID=A0A3P3UFA5_9BACL|nr:hypothetical protein [Paenibacillus oralis]RRJ67143.1 hypothetical protein EHV15_32615 [Paenibacillus oralis]
MKRRTSLFALFMALCLALTGCLGAPRTETIILDDAEQQPSGEEVSSFAVQTIYSALDGQTDNVYPLGWIDNDALLTFTPEYPSRSHFDRVNGPYTAWHKLSELDSFSDGLPLESVVLSPDGGYASYMGLTDGVFQLYLHSLDDGGNTRIETTRTKQILVTRMSWSNNSRFFCYAIENEVDGAVQLGVYDTMEGNGKKYFLPFKQPNELVSAVYISDNGEDAAVVKQWGQDSVLEFGELRGNEFISQYRHPISNEGRGWVEWIHQDQIAFAGADGTLYAYDRRNGNLSILLKDIEQFRLSSDRKLVAYTQGGDSVYAATLYGNNVLDMKQIYKGFAVSEMAWSPNNRKLLIFGLKSKEQSEYAELKNRILVIEFK